MNFDKEKLKENKDMFLKYFKKIFPHFVIEGAVAVLLISVPLYASKAIPTATLAQEMAAMKTNNTVITTSGNNNTVAENGEIPDLMLNTPNQEVITKTIEFETAQMCFIGDKRFESMNDAITTDAMFVTDKDAGLSWLSADGLEALNNADRDIYIFALGLNDTNHVDGYIEAMNNFASEHQDKFFIFTTIPKIDESKYKDTTNQEIEKFNEAMISGLNEQWQIVDFSKYVEENGYITEDGVNYTRDDCLKAFAWLVDAVKMQKIASE